MFEEKIPPDPSSDLTSEGLLALADSALAQVDALLSAAREGVFSRVAPQGAVDASLLNQEQMAAHGLAWYATYGCALVQMRDWGKRLAAAKR